MSGEAQYNEKEGVQIAPLQQQQQQQHVPVPVQMQPGNVQVQWMVAPAPIPGVPPGLEYLSQVDQLLVHQQVEMLEVLTGFETKNRYQIKNSVGQQVYFAQEESELCMRLCCGPARGFSMHITDNLQREVIRIVREFKCCAGCCWCANADTGTCSFELAVEAPVGQIVGYVSQSQSCWKPCYDLKDANKQCVLKIKGPCCPCQGPCCPCDFDFKIYSKDMANDIGSVTKQYSGCLKEAFTNASNFGVTFPLDLDAKMKAVALAATFLIDFMYFEENNNN